MRRTGGGQALDEQGSTVGKGKGRASGPPGRTYIGRKGPLFAPRLPLSSDSPSSPPMDPPVPIEDVSEYYDYTHLDGDAEEYGQWVDHNDFGLPDHWQPEGAVYPAPVLEPAETAKAIHAALNALQDYVGD
jgi:hypothetical protein